jgi:DNA-binding CsgD family transcriptional regulator
MMGEQEAERATAGEWLLGTDSAAEGGDTSVQSGPDGQTGATLVHSPESGLTAVADRPPLDGRAAVRRPTGSRDLGRLHDRQGELEEFQRVFSRPRETPSGAIIVEGGWGLGKTALLNAAAGIAQAGDVSVLRARGGQLEQHVAFGVVQQLLDSLADRDSAELKILTDAERAMLAAAVEHTRELRADPLEVGRLAHRLWTSIASRLPLALVVDDADHADVESLAVLHYLVRRLGAVPVWVLLSGRPRVPGSPLRPLDRIAADPRARLMSLSRLRSGSVAQLVAQHFDEDPDPAAVEVYYAMSWGNPLLLFALLAIFPSDARPGPSDVSATITEKGLPRLAAAIQERVSALPLAAAHLLEAVAVLGDRADLSLAGLLARIDSVVAERVAEDLVGAELLVDGRPLCFESPLVRAAVYRDISPSRRTRLHKTAARLLAEQIAPVDAIADQLIAAGPTGDEAMVDLLQDTGRRALDGGAATLAARCFERALLEPPWVERRTELLLDQAIAEAASGAPVCVELFKRAIALGGAERDHLVRAVAAIATALPDAMTARDTVELLQGVTSDLDASYAGPVIRLEVASALTGDALERLAALTRLERLVSAPATPPSREARIARSHILVQRARNPEWVTAERLVPQLREVLDADDLASADSLAMRVQADAAELLLRSGDVYATEAFLRLAHHQAVVQDHALAVASTSTLLALAMLWQGNIADAEREVRAAQAVAEGQNWAARSLATSVLADTLLLQGCVGEARQLVEEAGPAEGAALVTHLETKGRVRVASGDTALGLMDLLAAGDEAERLGIRNPAITSWRAEAASAYVALNQPREAETLAMENLELARSFGSVMALGPALRAAAKVTDLGDRVPLLKDAIMLLDQPATRVELVAALIDLGAALRQVGEAQDARRVLRRAAHLASGYGAVQLANDAANELRATGARPRRLVLTGPESLTPSEQKVATLAAAGQTNASIARTLYIAEKTVEGHLARVYQKLEIDSRAKLVVALGNPSLPVQRGGIYAVDAPGDDSDAEIRSTG